MAKYDFIVAGLDPVLIIESHAASDVCASQEALRFASELMRETAVIRTGSFDISVAVKTQDGQEICRVSVSSRVST